MDGRDYDSINDADTIIEGEMICIEIPIEDNDICDGKRHFLLQIKIPCFDTVICIWVTIWDDDVWSTLK